MQGSKRNKSVPGIAKMCLLVLMSNGHISPIRRSVNFNASAVHHMTPMAAGINTVMAGRKMIKITVRNGKPTPHQQKDLGDPVQKTNQFLKRFGGSGRFSHGADVACQFVRSWIVAG